MNFKLFYHSLVSDWNHGNAHFLRGVASELMARGHRVDVYEPEDGWSRTNLLKDEGEEAVRRFEETYPGLQSSFYCPETLDVEQELQDADVVIMHEWTHPDLIYRIGQMRKRGASFALLYHDTHHRAATRPEYFESHIDLSHYDGVLAYGEALRQVYVERDWAKNVWTWHEGADTRVFRPRNRDDGVQEDLVWIGNWGDDERTEALEEFLLEPVSALDLRAAVHGVRYPPDALYALKEAGIDYRGWVANHEVPAVYARFRATVHIPRKAYLDVLPGIPTIRVFEALACGIPLIVASWCDTEGLFTPGRDFLVADSTEEMAGYLDMLMQDRERASALAEHGRQTILDRHTCAHRVDELLAVLTELGVSVTRDGRPARTKTTANGRAPEEANAPGDEVNAASNPPRTSRESYATESRSN